MNDGNIVEFLLKHNESQSLMYRSPDQTLSRRQYRAVHGTEVASLECMDGRVNLPRITKIPTGIIRSYRNVGAKFDFGWPYFGQLIQDWVSYSVGKGRDCLLLITYHWSKGQKSRGCKGFGCSLERSQKYTADLRAQAERIFGNNHSVVYPIQIGIETDQDSLLVHGNNGEILDLAKLKNGDTTPESLRILVEKLFPDMKRLMVIDLVPLLLGNLQHIAEVKKSNRAVSDVKHGEDTIALGRDFSWLLIPNKALVVGPFSYDLREPIATAAHIVWENLKHGRIPKEKGAVLMVSALSGESAGFERTAAIEKANSLAMLGQETIRKKVPGLMPYLQVLVGTVDSNTMLFTPQ